MTHETGGDSLYDSEKEANCFYPSPPDTRTSLGEFMAATADLPDSQPVSGGDHAIEQEEKHPWLYKAFQM
jgi:hypothetical protein